ncbi:hypothetical protein DEU56DRAFT_749658 [Suillus clintonianus]|uniref:uncharacterized protein n=1 Tax=Suillus clintonianus TaxID=1904413 RepID=UPI001B87574D|nr:uncharacterized protein DEU56DRAFT_749658 [Suillus clintonianus]KAG2111120.1 hypothetical protein DEU56DRAFT_749658 [Suillus clintonianus]
MTGSTPLLPLNSSTAPSSDSKRSSELELPAPKRIKSSSTPYPINPIAPRTRFSIPLVSTSPSTPKVSSPQRYKPGLVPLPSSLRPHCLARERLRKWLPAGDSTRRPSSTEPSIPHISVSDDQLNRILEVIGSSWAETTKETYGAGLLVFHVYCDSFSIPEEQRCPVSPTLLLAFLSSCAGSYSGAALANYAAGLKAWHLLHGRSWMVNTKELKAILDGATALAPSTSKSSKRNPFTVDILATIHAHVNLDDPLDAAVFACITTMFFTIARLGEFTVPAIKAFKPSKHITRENVSTAVDRNGLPVTKFHIPSTKMAPTEGEDAYWAAQEGPCDPKAALENHFRVNPAGDKAHLFAWKHPKGLRPLSKPELSKRLTAIARAASLPDLKGHGLRIGGTLEYLLRGIPFDVVKSMGRWSSDAFTLYLRDHAVIIAPYIQASPALEPFTRHTMPQVR